MPQKRFSISFIKSILPGSLLEVILASTIAPNLIMKIYLIFTRFFLRKLYISFIIFFIIDYDKIKTLIKKYYLNLHSKND